MRKYRFWTSSEIEVLKNGIIPEGRTYKGCSNLCQRLGIKFPGITNFNTSKIMLEKTATTTLSAIEKCPPDCYCGIAKKPSWNIANAAKMLGVCVNTLRNWVNKAKNNECSIPFYQSNDNSQIFFPIRELVDWDESKRFHK